MEKIVEVRLYINKVFVAKFNGNSLPPDLNVEAHRIANLTKTNVKLEYDYARDRNIIKQEAVTYLPDGGIEMPTRDEVERIAGKEDDIPF